MKTALVTWMLPTTRESGNPLPVAEIAGTDVDLAVAPTTGAPVFTNLGTRMPPPNVPQEWTIPDLAAGNWIVRLVLRTVDGGSATTDTPFVVPDDSNPSPIVTVNVTLS